MSTAACCLPTVITTHTPWPRRASQALRATLAGAWAAWRRQAWHADGVSSLRGLSPQTLRDIGLAGCVHDAPAPPRTDWEFGRWH